MLLGRPIARLDGGSAEDSGVDCPPQTTQTSSHCRDQEGTSSNSKRIYENYGQNPYFDSLCQILQALEATLSQIVKSNPQTLELGPSQIEGGSPALFISQENFNSNHDNYPRAPREVFHSHCEAEGSSHAILSAADAMLVLDKGWGERHAISGKGLGPPLGYIMIFAPRNMREVEIVGIIARAAARYGLEGKRVY